MSDGLAPERLAQILEHLEVFADAVTTPPGYPVTPWTDLGFATHVEYTQIIEGIS